MSGGPARGGGYRVRAAVPSDVPTLLAMTCELAEYERAGHEVVATVESFGDALFGPAPRAFALVAEAGADVAGMAIYFVSFSTWTGRHGLYLEDLFVRLPFRRLGIGRALLAELAARAVERGYSRLEWAVLDWNEPAVAFYRSIGARPVDGWTTFRLAGDGLAAVAGSAAPRRAKPEEW
jgi:GNAT superfamily N-acetyltransferase